MTDRIIELFIRNKQIVYSLFFLITLAILLLTLMPPDNLGSNRIFQYDKLGHFMMFFCWTLAYGFFSFARKGAPGTNLVVIFIVASIFGITVEFLQKIMPYGRSAGIFDAAADILGSLSATLLLKIVKSKLETYKSSR